MGFAAFGLLGLHLLPAAFAFLFTGEFGGRTPMSGQRVSYVAKNGFDAKGNACILAETPTYSQIRSSRPAELKTLGE